MAPRMSTSSVDDLGVAGQGCRADSFCLGRHGGHFVVRGADQVAFGGVGDCAEQDQVAEAVEEVRGEAAGVVARVHEAVDGAVDGGAVACGEAVDHVVDQGRVGDAQE